MVTINTTSQIWLIYHVGARWEKWSTNSLQSNKKEWQLKEIYLDLNGIKYECSILKCSVITIVEEL